MKASKIYSPIMIAFIAVILYTFAVIFAMKGDWLKAVSDIIYTGICILLILLVRENDNLKENYHRAYHALSVITDLHDKDTGSDAQEISEKPMDYKDRMKEEWQQLRDRTVKLEDFLSTDKFKELPENKRTLLHKQYESMSDYLDILEERCNIEGIQLDYDT